MRNLRTAISVLVAMLMFFASPARTEEKSVVVTRISACGKLPSGQKWIGWGPYGLQFSVPTDRMKVLGGDPDVDYVRFIITPNDHDAALELWFGSVALGPKPRPETLKASVTVTQTKLVNSDGANIGWDSRGEKRDHTRWRRFSVTMEGAVYEDVSAADAAIFDRIIETACFAPRS